MNFRLSLLLFLLASCVHAQPLRQNPQLFQGSATSISVTNGAPVVTEVTIGTRSGILYKIIVGGHNGSASGSSSFDVRICQAAPCTSEDSNSIFQIEGISGTGGYPYGLYVIPDIIFRNADSPAQKESLYVRIKNNTAGTATFDIYLAGAKMEEAGE